MSTNNQVKLQDSGGKMKIGTKTNAIDDLGKFDGSKMTIKVNGKQIYTQKRYFIVRGCTDNGIYRCPTNNGKCLYPKGVEVYCKKCAEINGDTKQQLIKKITTVLKREKIKRGLTYYWLATKIVEFLRVE